MQRDFKVITFKHKFNTQIERKMIKVSTNNNKNGLAYSSKDINRNFRIKVSGVDAQGRKVHKLVGVAGAIAMGIFVVSSFFRILGIARRSRRRKSANG